MTELQRQQSNRSCSSSDSDSDSEVLEKAWSILRLATATSGFVVKNPTALSAVCAYLASEQLNSGEISFQSAVAAAHVMPHEFSDILKEVRAALGIEEQNTIANVTYEALVDAHRVHPRKALIACMECTQGGFSRFDMLMKRYGANVMTCAIFFWVCQLMEEPSVQEQSFCQVYCLPPETFKAAVAVLNEQDKGVAARVKAYLLPRQSAAQASASSQASHVPQPKSASRQKLPVKSALRPKRGMSTSTAIPSMKRTVTFSDPSSSGIDGKDCDNNDDDDNASASKSATSSRVVCEAVDATKFLNPDQESPPRKRLKKGKERAHELNSSDDEETLALDRIEQRLLTMQTESKRLETEQANVLAEIAQMKARRRHRAGK